MQSLYVRPLTGMIKQLEAHVSDQANATDPESARKLANMKRISHAMNAIRKLLTMNPYTQSTSNTTNNLEMLEAAEKQIKHWMSYIATTQNKEAATPGVAPPTTAPPAASPAAATNTPAVAPTVPVTTAQPFGAPGTALSASPQAKTPLGAGVKSTFHRFVSAARELDTDTILAVAKSFSDLLDNLRSGLSMSNNWKAPDRVMDVESTDGETVYPFWFDEKYVGMKKEKEEIDHRPVKKQRLNQVKEEPIGLDSTDDAGKVKTEPAIVKAEKLEEGKGEAEKEVDNNKTQDKKQKATNQDTKEKYRNTNTKPGQPQPQPQQQQQQQHDHKQLEEEEEEEEFDPSVPLFVVQSVPWDSAITLPTSTTATGHNHNHNTQHTTTPTLKRKRV
eukprot:TRINITY_DN5567_c1_g1_i1.p1 TRINITY_DN5567_c1_g1~~TRINITY_DN5567_c1_g1_i1.p1  ORF type:complete len:440 (+),score=197.19 TRINITY_DN5567_c1_g1_i1:154-1320(+)